MTPQLAIITGLSGAGRTTAAKVLEDLGYFVIDNMPPQLIERVVDLATAPGSTVDRVALVVDVRGRHFFGDLHRTVQSLEDRGLSVRVLFLESADEALVKRYEAARRAHPLSGRGVSSTASPGSARCSPTCGRRPTSSSTRPTRTSTSSATAWWTRSARAARTGWSSTS